MGFIRASNEWEDRENKVKERLRSYRSLTVQYRDCCDLFDRLYPKATSQFYPDKVMSSGINTNEELILKRIDLESQMAESLRKMKDEMELIMKMIESLPAEESVVLLRRYTMAECMENVAEILQISVRHCWRLHKTAIQRLAKAGQ
jgi:DNA-directed RNA polymerase specialized sigma subunit